MNHPGIRSAPYLIEIKRDVDGRFVDQVRNPWCLRIAMDNPDELRVAVATQLRLP